MLLHLDASTHAWLRGKPPQDLVVMLDDADGRILYAQFWPEEGTASTFAALYQVLTREGRFGDIYTDRASHFCRTSTAGAGPDAEQHGQLSRALHTLGIQQILARSPEARGRSGREPPRVHQSRQLREESNRPGLAAKANPCAPNGSSSV